MTPTADIITLYPPTVPTAAPWPPIEGISIEPPDYTNDPLVPVRAAPQAATQKGKDPRDRLIASLELAEREGFLQMCRSSLWGKEAAEGSPDYLEFGEMLRGLVETYLPENAWHLQLLRSVAHAQWALNRLFRLQASVFEKAPAGHVEHGIPRKTAEASELGPQIDAQTRRVAAALETLERALKVAGRVRAMG